MTKDEALQMCLEYIETDAHERKYVRHAIKKALAAPVQEPVATIDSLEQEIYENTREFVSLNVMEWLLKRLNTTPLAQPAPVQEPVEVDQATMELAESVGLIGPASRTHDLHAAIQRFHDLICVNATIKAAKMAADAIRESTPPAQPAPVQEPVRWSDYEPDGRRYPAVPDALTSADIQEHIEYVAGWNDCRQAMLEMMK